MNNPSGVSKHTKRANILFFGQLWKRLNNWNRPDLNEEGNFNVIGCDTYGLAKPDFVVSHMISIEDVPAAYR